MCLLLRSGFSLATLPYRSDWWIAAEMVVLLEGSPLSTEERWSSDSDHRVLGHSPDKGPSPPIAQFRRPASSRKSPGGSKLLPFTDDGSHCAQWDLQSSRIFFCAFPQICSSRQSCLGGLQAIPLTSCLVCALTCTVNCGTLYRQVCAFPNHVQSTEFTTGGLQLCCRNIFSRCHYGVLRV